MGIRIEQIENLSQYIQSLISGTTNTFVPFTGAQMSVNLNTKSITAGSFWSNNGRVLLLASSTFAHSTTTTSVILEITNLLGNSNLMGSLEFEIFRYIGKSYKFNLSTYIYQSSWHASSITWTHGISSDISSIELIKHNTISGKYYVRINFSTSMEYGSASLSYIGSSNFNISNATFKFYRNTQTNLDLTDTNSTIIQTIPSNSFVRDPYVLNYNNLTNAPAITRFRSNTNAYLSGDITLTAGTNMSLTQSGNVITLSSANTTYTAGNGLTLSGTAFSLPVTQSGSGNVVDSVVSSANGITVTKGLTAMLTSHAANAITSANITSWNTAAGWGNHSGLYVSKSGDTMTGALVFSGDSSTGIRRDVNGLTTGAWSRLIYNVSGSNSFSLGHFGSGNTITYSYFGTSYDNTFIKFSNNNINIGYRASDTTLRTNAILSVGDSTARTLSNTYAHYKDNAIVQIAGQSGTYGVHMGVDSTSGAGWIQALRNDATQSTYNLIFNPIGGQVSIGYLTASQIGTHKMGINGTLLLTSGGTSNDVFDYGGNYHSSYTSRSLVDKEYVDSLVATSAVTQTRLRSNTNAYLGGDITLSAGANMVLTQSGNIITLSSTPNTDTTYTAGNGLTLSGTQFSLPVTQSGSGSFVTSVVSGANGITVTKGDVPANSLVTSSSATGVTNVATTNNNTFLNIVRDGSSLGSSTQIQGAGGTTITSDTAGKITISSTNTTYSGGTLALLTAGTDTSNYLWSSKNINDWLRTILVNDYKQINIPGFNFNDYIDNAIILCDLTNDAISANRYFEGSIILKRVNTLGGHQRIYVKVSKYYNSLIPAVTYYGDLGNKYKFGTFTYNSRTFFGLITTGISSNYNQAKIEGFSNTWGTIQAVPYKNNTPSAQTIINPEINDSIVNWSYTSTTYSDNFSIGSYTESMGYIKRSSSDSYVLLGGGGHKLISDFSQTTTRIRSNSNSYVTGDITLSAGANVTLTQSGNVITLSSTPNTNTTYTAGSGLTLTGTQFNLPVTVTGSGTYVQSVAQNANGLTVTLGTPPNTDTTYTAGSGLTLSGAQFSLPVTVTGSGTYVQSVEQNANGLTVTLGTPPNTDTNTTYTAGNGLTLTGTQFSLPVTQSGTGNYVTSVVSSATGITVTKGDVPANSLVTSSSATGVTNVATTNTNTFLNIVRDGSSLGSSTQIQGAGGTTITSDTAGKITISSTNTNTTYTAGNGLTLSGTAFSLPVTTTGSGNVVDSVVSSATGISVTKNVTAMTTSHAANAITSANITSWNTAAGWGNHSGLYPSRALTNATVNSIRVLDTRDTNPLPSTDLKYGTWFDFKRTSAIELTGLGQSTYAGVMTLVPYSDDSGNINTAFMLAQSANNLYFRNYSSATNWDRWNRVITNENVSEYITNYTAGSGLTLSGTQFSLPITVSGSGNYVQSVAQNANGLTVTLGTPANNDTTYTAGNGLSLSGTQFSLPVTTTGSGNVVDSVVSSANGVSVTKNVTAMTTSHAANAITSANISSWNTAAGWGNHDGLYVKTSYLQTRQITTTAAANTKGFDVYHVPSSATDKPTGITDGSLISSSYSNIWTNQMFGDWRTNDLYLRNQNNGTWGSWVKVFHSGNFATGTTSQYIRGDGSLATMPSLGSTRLRANTNTYIDGDITLTAGTNMSLTQSGNVITLSSANTTYSAGNGLTLSGTQFSLPITASGTGNTVTTLTQTTNGLTASYADRMPLFTNRPTQDLNILRTSGIYGGGSGSNETTNYPSEGYSYSPYMVLQSSVDRFAQIWVDSWSGNNNNDTIHYRSGSNTQWGAWRKMWHSGNLTKLSQLTNDVGFVTSTSAYTAGNGLTLTGTQFSLPVTQSGTGNYVTSVVSSSSGITVTKGNIPANSLVTSSSATGVTNVATTNTNTFLNIVRDGSSLGSSTQIQGAGGTTITSDTAGKITISSTNTNTTYTAGNGLTLSGTQFSLPITVSGAGSYVSSITQTTNGLTVNMGSSISTRIGANGGNYTLGDINFVGAGNTSISKSGNTVTISSSGGGGGGNTVNTNHYNLENAVSPQIQGRVVGEYQMVDTIIEYDDIENEIGIVIHNNDYNWRRVNKIDYFGHPLGVIPLLFDSSMVLFKGYISLTNYFGEMYKDNILAIRWSPSDGGVFIWLHPSDYVEEKMYLINESYGILTKVGKVIYDNSFGYLFYVDVQMS